MIEKDLGSSTNKRKNLQNQFIFGESVLEG
ncbi:hypothetical protein P872_01405 [Rhodonellum psychrophilum GCM71 = DSM 17998]|uniref:Uncharacterized protein n=1 Tax=Rhodonellum psychrophilum GCM71 = DSM 17998 TaxID=1123057 RepID=U5C2C3_9BACT|nr:hypothetical protein P872_01405 [Rhodonellum psychrophilum GCM71 = DSM 17998]